MLSMHTSPLAALGGKETGGMNVYVRELAHTLGARGWGVDVFTRLQDPSLPRVDPSIGPNCRVIHIPAGPPEAVDRRALYPFLPAFVEGIQAFCAQEGLRYDLIHSHYWLSGWAARGLREAWRVPLVQMFHTLGRMKDSVADGAEQREAADRAAVEQEVMEAADRIVAATPLDRQQMLDLYAPDESKIVVIPCGVNLERFRPIERAAARKHLGLEDGRELLLFVGRLDPVKGLDVLLEAMCELTRNLRPARAQDLSLAVIGGDRESHLEALMSDLKCLQEIRQELGLEDLVVFIGSRAQEELPYYYSAALACVMPSLYESFGMVALEAMACGTPVIASRVGGLTFTVRDGETGFLVPEKDPKALAQKLELVVCNECLRARLGRRAIEIARGYSWEIVADDIEALYAELGVA
ncbi:MAG: glycosyltransferase family 1 protein [Chloroflexi bacterium]|nr:glycosyltransferase family 1 protein [Chloroflexota bacterium]